MPPPAEGGGGGGGDGDGGRGQGRQQQQQQQAGGLGQTITGIIRIAVFWYFASKFFSPKKTSEPAILISNLFQKGEPLVRPQTLSLPICMRLYLYAYLLSGFNLNM